MIFLLLWTARTRIQFKTEYSRRLNVSVTVCFFVEVFVAAVFQFKPIQCYSIFDILYIWAHNKVVITTTQTPDTYSVPFSLCFFFFVPFFVRHRSSYIWCSILFNSNYNFVFLRIHHSIYDFSIVVIRVVVLFCMNVLWSSGSYFILLSIDTDRLFFFLLCCIPQTLNFERLRMKVYWQIWTNGNGTHIISTEFPCLSVHFDGTLFHGNNMRPIFACSNLSMHYSSQAFILIPFQFFFSTPSIFYFYFLFFMWWIIVTPRI